MEVGEERFHLKPGDSAFGPMKVPHTWAFVAGTRGRMLFVVSPIGKLEAFFVDAEKRNAAPSADQNQWQPYGLECVGLPGRGWEQVAQIVEHAASSSRDGEMVAFEIIAKYMTLELAFVVEIERTKAKIGRSEDVTPFALRVTMIFRPEDGVRKIVHRHADPITTPQPVESVIQK